MEKIQHYYKILGIKAGASLVELEQAYLDEVNALHEGRHSDDPVMRNKAHGKLKELNMAYEEIKKRVVGQDTPDLSREGTDAEAPPAGAVRGAPETGTARAALAKSGLESPAGGEEAPGGREGVAAKSTHGAGEAGANVTDEARDKTPGEVTAAATTPAVARFRHLVFILFAFLIGAFTGAFAGIFLAARMIQAPAVREIVRQPLSVKQTAADGDAGAQAILGAMYYSGEGVPKDYRDALYWFRKAAEQGEATAQYNLGYMYYNGEGVEPDMKEAAKWFRLAAAQRDDKAIKALRGMGER